MLISDTQDATSTAKIVVEPTVAIPLPEYRQEIEKLRTALALPISSEVVVTFTMRVTGIIEGTSFTDTKVSTVMVPLDQQIYQPKLTYEKTDAQQVQSQALQENQNVSHRMQLMIAAVIALAGAAAIVYGLRKQIFKTAYQRELDRIYRYHDGIIIRASQAANLTKKNVVPVLSFDDMLNLEEELKTPIVAAPAGSTATKFMIVHSDVVYVYTLGREVVPVVDDAINEIDATITDTAKKQSSQHDVVRK